MLQEHLFGQRRVDATDRLVRRPTELHPARRLDPHGRFGDVEAALEGQGVPPELRRIKRSVGRRGEGREGGGGEGGAHADLRVPRVLEPVRLVEGLDDVLPKGREVRQRVEEHGDLVRREALDIARGKVGERRVGALFVPPVGEGVRRVREGRVELHLDGEVEAFAV